MLLLQNDLINTQTFRKFINVERLKYCEYFRKYELPYQC
jgi:hypothetical protein